MSQGVNAVGLYVDDQDVALVFYTDKLGSRMHTDVHSGPYRWLTVRHPEQPSFQPGLFQSSPPIHGETTTQMLRAMVVRGAMSPLVLTAADCHAAHAQLHERGAEFTQEPIDRFGSVDADFHDPAGSGWRMIQAAGGVQ